MKFIKIFFYNLLILFFAFISIEIIFGYWFDKDNLGPYMREHRMKKNFYSLKYDDQTYDYVYKRNYYGFRGEETNLKNIKAVMIGGSTVDERYKPDDFTIIGYLNKKLSNENIKLEIINAGIEGQSTLGHIYNFEVWFPKLKEFNPQYFIFYIGINDHIASKTTNKSNNGHVLNPSKSQRLKDNIKSRSIFYDLLRKTKHKYYNKGEKLVYDFNYALKKNEKLEKFNFLKYQDAIKLYDLKKIKDDNKSLIKNYLLNIDKLEGHAKRLNAKAIFINQLTNNGNYNKKLFILNHSLIKHCKEKKFNCIDLAKKLNGKKEYWWDGIHTTPAGSKKIADLIYPELKNFLKKN